MENVLIVYIIIQLITTAFGIAVIESVRPLVEKRLHDKGYIQKRQNSLYEFNDKIVNVLLGFVPFYYFIKALSIINNKNAVNEKVREEIKKGNYVLHEKETELEEEKPVNDLYNPELSIARKKEVFYEKPEKYTARKNDITLYDTYETPIEYITREAPIEESLELTPFNKEEEEKVNVPKKEEVKPLVTKADIAKAISELDAYELDLLKDKIATLANIKRENVSLKLKDVA